jgi:hypothetical protein
MCFCKYILKDKRIELSINHKSRLEIRFQIKSLFLCLSFLYYIALERFITMYFNILQYITIYYNKKTNTPKKIEIKPLPPIYL